VLSRHEVEGAPDPAEVLKEYASKIEAMKPNRRVFIIDAAKLREVYAKLLDVYGEEGVYLSTLVGVDRPEQNIIELNYFIHIIPRGETIVLRTYVNRQDPRIRSLAGLTGTLSGEFETYDLLGVVFEGNEWLRRGFFVPADVVEKGVYPLRKDAKV